MTREAFEMHPQDNFDQDDHIAEFLHTSAVYLGVNAVQVTAQLHRSWQRDPAILSQEVQHA